MTQTAVSEMFAQIKAARKDTQFWNDSMLVDWLLESEKTFKSTEKQQTIKTYIAGSLTGCGCYDYMTKEDGEQYYNETYGGKK